MLVLVVALGFGRAQAGLLGTTMTVTYNLPTASTIFAGPYDFLVGPGVELNCPPDVPFCGTNSTPFSLDFTDNKIIYSYGPGSPYGGAPDPFDGWVFTDQDLDIPIDGFTLSSYGFTGLNSDDVSFTSDSISINLAGDFSDATSGWTLTLLTAPEPRLTWPTGAFLGVLAALSCGFGRRRHTGRKAGPGIPAR